MIIQLLSNYYPTIIQLLSHYQQSINPLSHINPHPIILSIGDDPGPSRAASRFASHGSLVLRSKV